MNALNDSMPVQHAAQMWGWKPPRWDLTLLENIPGLRVAEREGKVYGQYDAVEIACRRFGVDWRQVLPTKDIPNTPPQAYAYQRAGVNWLCAQLKRDGSALLADDMGLGKTAQAIWAADALRRRTLVICPGSVRPTWERQIQKWAGVEPSVIYTGAEAIDVNKLQAHWVVTSYELAKKLLPSYCPGTVIIDEAHMVSGRWAQRARRVDTLVATANYCIALTGTPMWARPRDLWMLLRIMFRTRFGSAEEFDFAYCDGRINEFGGRDNDGTSRPDELKARLGHVMLRRLKTEVASELPALTRTLECIEPPREVRALYMRAMTQRRGFVDAMRAALVAKMPRAVEVAAEAGQFLLLTWLKEHAHTLHRKLNEEAKTPCVLITGDTPPTMRQALVDQAVREKCGIVATTDSCAVGVDGLQHAAHIGIFHALDWLPLKIAQAEARLYRQGQTLPVQWVYLAMRDTLDQQVIDAITSKLDSWSSVMGMDDTQGIHEALHSRNDDDILRAIYAELGGDM